VSYFHNRIVCTDNGGWVGLGYFAVANRWIKKIGPMAISDVRYKQLRQFFNTKSAVFVV